MIAKVTRSAGDNPQAERLREIHRLLGNVDSRVGTLDDLIVYVTRTDETLAECLIALEALDYKNDRLTRRLEEKLRLILELRRTIERKSREGDELSRDKVHLQQLLATALERVAWHADRNNKTRGEGDSMSANGKGQRHLPMWAILLTLFGALALGYMNDTYWGLLSYVQLHTHIVLSVLLCVAAVALAVIFVIQTKVIGNEDHQIGNGESPNGEITAAEDEVTTAQTAVNAARDALNAAVADRDAKKGAVNAALLAFERVLIDTRNAIDAARVDPATPVADLVIDIRATKTQFSAANAARQVWEQSRTELQSAETEVDRRKEDLEAANEVLDEMKQALEDARNSLRPARKINGYQIRLVLAILWSVVWVYDACNVNYMIASARAQEQVVSTFWVSAHCDPPKVNKPTPRTDFIIDNDKVQIGIGTPIVVGEPQPDGTIPVFVSAKLAEGIDWNRVVFYPMRRPDKPEQARK